MSPVQLTIDDKGIAIVTLNRPHKRNAMDMSLLHALVRIAQRLKRDRMVRCVILMGAEHIFSAGIDLKEMSSPRQTAYIAWQLLKPGQSIFQKACLAWQGVPVPVIAVLEGYCFGAGLQLALAADIRISASDTQLSIMESRWGLVPDMGITQTLKGVVALDVAKELAYSGRVFDASYAHQVGLITHMSDQPYDHAYQLACEFITRSPDALKASKQVLNAVYRSPSLALTLEKYWQFALILGKNSRLARKKQHDSKIDFTYRQF